MTHRNRQLLDLAHEAPCCLQLGAPGCGNHPSVPCHSDMIRHGRGVGHKSHDCLAVPGCPACHDQFKRSILGEKGYHEAWTAAMERYTLYLWVSGKIQVTAAPKAGKEPSMEPPKCRLCEKNHWAREGCDFSGKKVTRPTQAEIERNAKTSSAIEKPSPGKRKTATKKEKKK